MDLNDVRSLVTLAGLTLFLVLAVWTWRPARQPAHDAAARLPFDGEIDSSPEAGPQAERTPHGG